jgi:nuclear transcription Y subunit beta
MSDLQPITPAHDNGVVVDPSPETTEPPAPTPITEQEVGEYREQDRFLPVSTNLHRYSS